MLRSANRLSTIAVIALALAACEDAVPECASENATGLAKSIIASNSGEVDGALSHVGVRADWSTIRVDAIRAKGQDEKTGERTCAARYLVDATSVNGDLFVLQRGIAYTIEKTEKDGKFYVYVESVGKIDRAADAAPVSTRKLAQAPKPSKGGGVRTVTGELSCGNATCEIESVFVAGPILDKVLPTCKTGDRCKITGTVDGDGALVSVASVAKL